jgi:hypothetical protein
MDVGSNGFVGCNISGIMRLIDVAIPSGYD